MDFIQDPTQPEISTILPNAAYTCIKKINIDQNFADEPPFVIHKYKTKSQITSIKKFPMSDRTFIGVCSCSMILSDDETPLICFDQENPFFIKTADIFPNELLIATNTYGNFGHIISTVTNSELYQIKCHSKPITGLKFAPTTGKLISTSLDGSIIITDLTTQKIDMKYFDNQNVNPITCLSSKIDESAICVGYQNGNYGLFDSRQKNGEVKVNAHGGQITSIDFHKENHNFATAGSDKIIKIWDLRNPSEALCPLKEAESPTLGIFMEGNEVICFTRNGILRVWNIVSQEQTQAYSIFQDGAVACDLDRGSRAMYVSGKDMVLSVAYF